jgi:hypothetical protein
MSPSGQHSPHSHHPITEHTPEQHEKNPDRVAAGLKASIHNPHVSKEAKESAAERLQQLENKQQHGGHHESSHVLGMSYLVSQAR